MGELIQVNFKREKIPEDVILAYKAKILGMDKLELLEEMTAFQVRRSKVGHLTPEMMLTGQILFKALTDTAETIELRLLTGSYCRHLKYEYDSYLRGTQR